MTGLAHASSPRSPSTLPDITKPAWIIIGLIALAAVALGFPVFFVVIYALIAVGVVQLVDRFVRQVRQRR